jgi:electron transfer flavoprotein-quinone oxidoreductase
VEQKFDAIVVGAGPAGCACAYKLAKAGLQILVVERGKFAGAKNMWGGAFYGPILGDLLPDFYQEAPFERYITHQRISTVSGESCLSIDYSTSKYERPPYNGFTVLRARFDQWFANKVQEAGVIVASGLAADDVLIEGGKICGIKAGNDKLPADIVIACDGVNSRLANKAGLRPELKPDQIKQGVKEVLQFPRSALEQRFNLTGNEGLAWEFLGCTKGLPGGGFIYTNKDSISIGLVVQLSNLAKSQVRAYDLLDEFKKTPVVAKVIEGGKLVEYSAHLIPIAGINMMPKLYSNGFLVAGDAAAFVIGTGLVLEGANFAVASGIAAAETVIKAKEKGDYSADFLSHYPELLKRSFVLKDLDTFKKAPHFLENPRMYTTYPELACNLMDKIFTNDGQPRKKTWELIKETMKEKKVSLVQMARDLFTARGAI